MSAFARAWNGQDLDEASAPEREASPPSASADPRASRILASMKPGVMNIVFQPVIDLRRGVIAGAEALARFAMEPMRTPDLWFQEAWDVNLGVELELYAIRRALDSLRRLPDGSHLAINASPQTLVSPLLDEALDGVPGERVVIELTEHAQVDDYRDMKEAIAKLRARGIRLAIDDAGAGFSSLQHILNLRPDLIKLDRSLTQGVDIDPVRYALAAALVTFARSLDAEICAEGIEKDAELAALQHLGIAYGQGYFLGRPLPLPLTSPPKGVWLAQTPSLPHVEASSPGLLRGSVRPVRHSLPVDGPRRSSRPHAVAGLSLPPPAEGSAVYFTDLVDGMPQEALDRTTRWARALLHAPLAVFTVVRFQREVERSFAGLAASRGRSSLAAEGGTTAARCVQAGDVGVLTRSAQPVGLSPTDGGSWLRASVRGPAGESIGTLAVCDGDERSWSPEEHAALGELAASLGREVELHGLRRLRAR